MTDKTDNPVVSVPHGEGTKVERSISVNRTPADLFKFWRNFENLPLFMDNLESVKVVDTTRSHWIANGPAGLKVEWDAEVHNEIPNELIAWRTIRDTSEVNHAGSVHFTPSANGTEIKLVINYEPPGGKVGEIAAKLMGQSPEEIMEKDLGKFKQLMEAKNQPA